jgi:hypothetical protein
MAGLKGIVNVLVSIIVNPLLALLFGAGLIVFLFGIVEFFFELDVRGNQSAKENGKNHMLWGLFGMFVMVSAWAIMQVIAATVGNPISSTPVPPT